ncbi:MAG TPA: DUF695 domain-containing protein [Burkholderiaceae bacterium]
MSQSFSEPEQSRGVVVETYKDGLPILWTYVPELPAEEVRLALPWLTVFAWRYDGSSRNGMPPIQVNESMMKLDGALGKIERLDFCVEAYRRMGCGLREFVFYVGDRDKFMAEFNASVSGHERYPIEIKFYKDESWSEFQELIDDLGVV